VAARGRLSALYPFCFRSLVSGHHRSHFVSLLTFAPPSHLHKVMCTHTTCIASRSRPCSLSPSSLQHIFDRHRSLVTYPPTPLLRSAPRLPTYVRHSSFPVNLHTRSLLFPHLLVRIPIPLLLVRSSLALLYIPLFFPTSRPYTATIHRTPLARSDPPYMHPG